MDKVPNRANMIGELLGKRKRLTYQSRTALTQGIVETLDIGRFTRLFANCLMTFGGQDTGIHLIEIGEANGPLTLFRR